MRRAVVLLLSYGFAALLSFGAMRLWTPVRVAGRSMEPALFAGDLVLVSTQARISKGDIALLERHGHGPVLHRVTRVFPDGRLTARGDANPIPDLSAYDASNARGRVVRVLPVGRVLAWWRRR